MVQVVCVIPNKRVVFNLPPFLDKRGVNLFRKSRPFGKRYETISGTVRVGVVIACRIQRPDIFVERCAELMFVFENDSGLKSIESFVLRLLPQRGAGARCASRRCGDRWRGYPGRWGLRLPGSASGWGTCRWMRLLRCLLAMLISSANYYAPAGCRRQWMRMWFW